MSKNKDWRYYRGLGVIIIGIIGFFLGAPWWFPMLMILFGVLMMFIFK
jgi:hypothetical protein